MRVIVLASIVLAATSAAAHWQGRSVDPVTIHNGFLTGTEYLALPEEGRWFYAAGLVDGILLAPLLGAPQANLVGVETCVTGMDNHQAAAILTAHLRMRPEIWHTSAHTAMYAALVERCPK